MDDKELRDLLKDELKRMRDEDLSGIKLIAEIKKQLERNRGEWAEAARYSGALRKELRGFIQEYDKLIARKAELNQIFKDNFESIGISREEAEKYCQTLDMMMKRQNEINMLQGKIDRISGKTGTDIDKQRKFYKEQKDYQEELLNKEGELISDMEAKNRMLREHMSELRTWNKEVEKTDDNFKELGKSVDEAASHTGTLTKNINKANFASSLLKSAWDGIKNAVAGSVSYYLKVEDATFKASRAMGLNREQAQTLTKVQLESVREFGKTLGITSERAIRFQKDIVNVTGRSIALNKEQIAMMGTMGDLTSDDIAKEWTASFNKFGASIETSRDMMAISRARAKGMGLDVEKATSAIAKNLGLLNQYTFRNGVDGLTRMALKAQELKSSIENVVKIADSFSNIEDAIKNSANLQMLGGSFTAMYSNPMGAMYEGIADPEAAMERAIKAGLSSVAYNRATGMVTPNGPQEMMRLKAAAQSLGMNPAEYISLLENRVKSNVVKSEIDRAAGFTEQQKSAIANLAGDNYDTEKKKHYINYVNTDTNEVTKVYVDSLTPKQLEEIQRLTPSEENAYKDISLIRKDLDTMLGITRSFEAAAKETQSTKENITNFKEGLYASSARDVVANPMQFFSDSFNNGFLSLLAKGLLYNGFLSLIGLTVGSVISSTLRNALSVGIPNAIGNVWGKFTGRSVLSKGRSTPPPIPKPATEGGGAATNAKPLKGKNIRQLRNLSKAKGLIKKGGKGALIAGGALALGYGAYKVFGGGDDDNENTAVQPATPQTQGATCDTCSELEKQTALLEKLAGISSEAALKLSSIDKSNKKKKEGTQGFLEDTPVSVVKNTADAVSTTAALTSMAAKPTAKLAAKMGAKGTAGAVLKAGTIAKAANPWALAGLATDLVNMGGQMTGAWDEGSITDRLLNVGSDAATGAGVGAMIGSAIPLLGNAAGAAVGGYIGGVYGIIDQFGEDIVNLATAAWDKGTDYLFGKSKTEEEEKHLEMQHQFETQKLGVTDINDPAIMEKAAYATIGIHDLLISKFNTDKGLKENGEEYGVFENEKGSIFNPLNWFSRGGIAKAARGMIVPGHSYEGDKVPALLNSGEMVLNSQEQKAMFVALKQAALTPIESLGKTMSVLPFRENSTYQPNFNIGPTDINLNVNGTIRLEANGNVGNIDLGQLLRNEDFKRQITEIIKTKLNEGGNAAKFNKESNNINTTKMYVGI